MRLCFQPSVCSERQAARMPAGSFVMHFGKLVHYDAAEDVETILQIVGERLATTTRAESSAGVAPRG
jgi:hypothetical protein